MTASALRAMLAFACHPSHVARRGCGGRHLLHLSLSSLVARLDPARFAQVHGARVVNLDHVRAFKRDERGSLEAELNDGTRIPVSRARAQEVRSPGR